MKRLLGKIRFVNEEELSILKRRIDFSIIVVVVLAASLVARLWHLQIMKGEEYVNKADNNRVRIREVTAPRGNILDRHGRIIANNRPSFDVVWFKNDTPDRDQVVKKLTRILDLDIATIMARVRKSSRQPNYIPVLVQPDINRQQVVYIENHRFEMPGVFVEVAPVRNYPYDNMLSHLLGYLGQITTKELRHKDFRDVAKGGDRIGKAGVEKRFETLLRGEKGIRYVEINAKGFEQQRLKVQESLAGSDIKLTIDAKLQHTAEQAMGGKAGSIIMMEINTGRLLVMASSPPMQIDKFIREIPFNIWKEHLANDKKPLINKSIQGQYPPGSTYKIVTALAGLKEKIITPDTTFTCNGYHKLHGRRYGCWKKNGHGKVNLKQALAQSCDVYFYLVGQKLGVDRLASYATNLGLGQKTGIGLEHEKAGLIPTRAWKKKSRRERWQDGETLSVAIGQGFNLATPLQICRMTAATANGGVIYRPQFVETITDSDGQIMHQLQPEIDMKVKNSTRALRIIREGLVAAVNDEHGTGGMAKMKDIVVGGKTGTAQVVRLAKYRGLPESKIPYNRRDHAWFTCYAPAEKPEIAITVLVEHSGHGGSVAAPIAAKILKEYFKKYGES